VFTDRWGRNRARRRRAVDSRPFPLTGCPVALSGDDPSRMRLELGGVEVRGEGWAETCGCTIENASAYVVSVITVVPSHRLGLVSAYVADLEGETAVTHMRLSPSGRRATFEQQVLGGLPGTSRPRACLLDHAAELRGALEELLDAPVSVEITEPTLEQASRVWGKPGSA